MIPLATILALGLGWLAYEALTAPVIDEPETLDDPYLAEEIRACLNAIDGVPIYEPGVPLPCAGSRDSTAPRIAVAAHPFTTSERN